MLNNESDGFFPLKIMKAMEESGRDVNDEGELGFSNQEEETYNSLKLKDLKYRSTVIDSNLESKSVYYEKLPSPSNNENHNLENEQSEASLLQVIYPIISEIKQLFSLEESQNYYNDLGDLINDLDCLLTKYITKVENPKIDYAIVLRMLKISLNSDTEGSLRSIKSVLKSFLKELKLQGIKKPEAEE
jgi:hypothetical protein